MSESMNRQLLRLSSLLQLEQQARRCGRDELPFAMVNETASVVPYRQAVLWQMRRREGRVLAVPGAAVPAADGPFLTWMTRLLRRIGTGPKAREIHLVTAADLGDDPDLAAAWGDWLPAEALWVPLIGPAGDLMGGLLLTRAERWTEADAHLFGYLGETYAHAWATKHLPAPVGASLGEPRPAVAQRGARRRTAGQLGVPARASVRAGSGGGGGTCADTGAGAHRGRRGQGPCPAQRASHRRPAPAFA
jgi:hypothetical protein